MSLPDNVWFWWTEVIIAIICVPILIVLCILHLYNISFDLCGNKKKKTMVHKSDPKLYTSMMLLSMITIGLYTFLNILNIAWMWNYTSVSQSKLKYIMEWDIKIGTISWFIAKQSMYTFFLLRLYTAYKSSIYAYNKQKLILLVIISTIAMFINIINVLIFTTIKAFYYNEISVAVHFNAYYPLWVVLMCGFPDVIISLIFIYLFLKPLKIVIDNVGKTNETKEGILELYNTGIKAFILTSMSTMTTLVFLLFILFFDALVILPIDSVINCLCIMMITPYYADHIYYQNICILPIKCSEKWTEQLRNVGINYEKDESQTTNTTTIQMHMSASNTITST
eukprot:536053_1